MHSFLYLRRARGPHISTLFYTCNMQKRENKAIFLRISGEMSKKTKEYAAGSKTQRKYAGLRAPQTPHPGLQPGLHRKTTFCFSVRPAGNTVTPNIPRQPASSLPASAGQYLPVIIFCFSIQGTSAFPLPTPFLPARPANTPRRPIFPYQASQPSISQYTTTAGRFHLPAANTLPILHFSFFFFLFFFSLFSFSFFLFLKPSSSPSHNQKSNSSYIPSATPAVLFFSALCCLYFYIFRPGNRQSAAARRAAGLKNLVS